MNILVRADSSSYIGTGHIMRDLVLAKEYKNENIIPDYAIGKFQSKQTYYKI